MHTSPFFLIAPRMRNAIEREREIRCRVGRLVSSPPDVGIVPPRWETRPAWTSSSSLEEPIVPASHTRGRRQRRHVEQTDGASCCCSPALLLFISAALVVSLPLCCVVMWSVVRLIGDSEEADTGINHDSTFDGSDGSRLIPASLSFNSWSAPISQTTNVFSHFRHSLHFSQGRFSDYFAKRH